MIYFTFSKSYENKEECISSGDNSIQLYGPIRNLNYSTENGNLSREDTNNVFTVTNHSNSNESINEKQNESALSKIIMKEFCLSIAYSASIYSYF